MWSSSIGKECNSSQVYCQAKGWLQKSQEFSNDLEKGFWSGKMEGEKNGLTWKSFENIFSSQNIECPFFKRERLLELFFLSPFFYASFSLFFLFSVSLLRMNSGIFEMFEEKTIVFQTFFQMGWKWLHQNLWNWGSCRKFIGGECIPWNGLMHGNKKNLGVTSNKILWMKNYFEKFKNSRRTHPLTKLKESKSFYVEYIWL
jgi:hypothetical protein